MYVCMWYGEVEEGGAVVHREVEALSPCGGEGVIEHPRACMLPPKCNPHKRVRKAIAIACRHVSRANNVQTHKQRLACTVCATVAALRHARPCEPRCSLHACHITQQYIRIQ